MDRFWWTTVLTPALDVVAAGVIAWLTRARQPSSRPGPDLGRLFLWRSLGALWLLDGILQLQPAMFTAAFTHDILQPAALGQPAPLASLMAFGEWIWSQAPIVLNLAAAVLQSAMGIAMLVWQDRRPGRIAAKVSIVWGLGVWVFGEGLGGILTGNANWFMGGPGSVILYMFGAVLLLAPVDAWRHGPVISTLRKGIAVVCLAGAFYQSWIPLWTKSGVRSLLSLAAATPQPSWLAAPIRAVAVTAGGHPLWANGLFVLILLGLGGVWWHGYRRPWLDGLIAAWLLFVWWMGQDFGIVGGVGTDPNTIPALAILMITAYIAQSPDSRPKNVSRPTLPGSTAPILSRKQTVPATASLRSRIGGGDQGRYVIARHPTWGNFRNP